MRNIEIVRYKQKLDNLFKVYDQLPEGNDLIKSHWSRYLCILTSGFIEHSLRQILISYIEKTSSRKTSSYAIKNISQFQNAKMTKIYDILKLFCNEWEEQIKEKTQGQLQEHVDSIVNNRHNIAHGKDVGISYVVISNYYKSAVSVIQIIEDILYPEEAQVEVQEEFAKVN
ncbi:HEPN domain-containing protein [Neobacillus ginsengisoli]|uniref:RiboL-PSP-HEPN domain-containing protein n=1 Tax=Neobacillus ginsengisoli TaxID=904295 RepID=A0ABT9XNH9_9BACI|nr:HEPN domain-containing protein [Neobacillus ginsengisoli]MDQ0197095.1 hypothetical protein [Neobacillus ginsengisoli]